MRLELIRREMKLRGPGIRGYICFFFPLSLGPAVDVEKGRPLDNNLCNSRRFSLKKKSGESNDRIGS